MEWVYDDGGRSAYFKGENVGDCVCRAIAIATESDYKQVYDRINELAKKEKRGRRAKSSARNGVRPKMVHDILEGDYGWEWHPCMEIGSGCKVHLRKSELPAGRLVCRVSGHEVAVIDGVVHDTYDCSRDEERCVYGYWKAPDDRGRMEKPRGHADKLRFSEEVFAYENDLLAGLITPVEFGRLCEKSAREWRGW